MVWKGETEGCGRELSECISYMNKITKKFNFKKWFKKEHSFSKPALKLGSKVQMVTLTRGAESFI